jgi:pantothenate kinase-related protein Tda10
MLIGLPYRQEYQTSEKPIIRRLLDLRNGIAHGDESFVNLAEYHQLHDRIDNLLVLYTNEVDNAVAMSRYKR